MPTASASFEPEPASVGSARRFAVGRLQAPTVEHLQDDVRTVVSELATNAVLHARTPFTITVQVDDAGVRVSVTDASPARPRSPRHGDVAGTTGRGLRIVAELSADWGVEVRSDGKTTWCLLTATAPSRVTGRSAHATGASSPAPTVGMAAAAGPDPHSRSGRAAA